MEELVCPSCHGEYKDVSTHLSMSSCQHPQFSDYQKEILKGLLLSDGHLEFQEIGNPRFRVSMISKEFLEWLDRQFPFYGLGVELEYSAEEASKRGEYGGNLDNWNDLYRWRTRNTPELNFLRYWYDSGEKVFPDGMFLSPACLKMWYIGDGSLENNSRPALHCLSQENDTVIAYLKQIVDEENIWTDGKRYILSTDSAEKFFEYMGSPLPGFEYKWK